MTTQEKVEKAISFLNDSELKRVTNKEFDAVNILLDFAQKALECLPPEEKERRKDKWHKFDQGFVCGHNTCREQVKKSLGLG